MKFTIEITDPEHLRGISAAAAAYNASLPEDADPLTDEAYVQFVMAGAAASYAIQYPAGK